MSLTLTIVNAERLDNGESNQLTLDRQGAVIGRSPHVDWSLPDPKSHVSSTHCEIAYRDGGYWLTDRSTNGTMLNGAAERMAAPHQLRDGDEFSVGHYRIEARLSGAARAEPARPAPASGWGGWEAAPAPAPSAWDGGPAPMGGMGAAAPAPVYAPAASGWDPIPADRVSAPPDGGRSDRAGPAHAMSGRGAMAQNWTPPRAQPPPGAAWAPEGPPVPAGVAWSEAPPPGANGWDVSEPAPPQATSSGWGAPVASAPGGQWPAPVAASSSDGWGDQAAAPAPAATSDDVWGRFAASNAVDWGRGGFAKEDAAPPAAPQPMAPPQQPRTQAPPPVSAEPAEPAAPPDASAGAWRALLAAAGVPPEDVRAAPSQAAAAAGLLLRRMAAGLVVMLEARARAKSQLGAQSTMLEFDGNNPLKFSRSPERVLAQLLNPPERGFMPAERAIEDAFHDLQAHQMATLAAMQGALRATLDRFSPQSIRDRAETRGLLAKIIPSARDAELWNAYEREFEGVAKGSDEAFMDVFAKEFKAAYEKAAAEMRGKR